MTKKERKKMLNIHGEVILSNRDCRVCKKVTPHFQLESEDPEYPFSGEEYCDVCGTLVTQSEESKENVRKFIISKLKSPTFRLGMPKEFLEGIDEKMGFNEAFNILNKGNIAPPITKKKKKPKTLKCRVCGKKPIKIDRGDYGYCSNECMLADMRKV